MTNAMAAASGPKMIPIRNRTVGILRPGQWRIGPREWVGSRPTCIGYLSMDLLGRILLVWIRSHQHESGYSTDAAPGRTPSPYPRTVEHESPTQPLIPARPRGFS